MFPLGPWKTPGERGSSSSPKTHFSGAFPPSSAKAHLLKWIGGGEGGYEKYKAFYFDFMLVLMLSPYYRTAQRNKRVHFFSSHSKICRIVPVS